MPQDPGQPAHVEGVLEANLQVYKVLQRRIKKSVNPINPKT